MKLTEERKKYIDSLSYEALLYKWRFSKIGDPWMADETGKYWGDRMSELRSKPGGDDTHVQASKNIGWDR